MGLLQDAVWIPACVGLALALQVPARAASATTSDASGAGVQGAPIINPAAKAPANLRSIKTPTPLSAAGAGFSPTSPISTAKINVQGSPSLVDGMWKGLNVNLPPPSNTIDPDPLGLRSTLASYGFGYQGLSTNTFYDNVLHAARSHDGQQLYVGQKPTLLSTNLLALSYDLTRFGIPDGQLMVVGIYISTSWEPLGPNSLNLGTLTYYQTLFNRRVEVKIGLLANSIEFVGPYIAGSLSGGVFGPSGSLFTQNGEDGTTIPTWGVNVTGHITKYLYDKVGVGRAIDPDGNVAEHRNNPTGLNFNTPYTGVQVINETGYLRKAGVDQPQTWVRGGGMYSASQFTDYDDGGRARGSYVAYLLADRQLWQESKLPAQAYRGVYAGFSVEYSPSSLNRFSQYYEARLYGLGLIPGREHDQTSVVFTDSFFSRILTEQAFRAGELAHHDSKNVTFSYNARLINGVYLNGAIGYTNNPTSVTYFSNTGSDLNLSTSIGIYF